MLTKHNLTKQEDISIKLINEKQENILRMSFMFNFITRPFRQDEPINTHTTPAQPVTIRTTQPAQRPVFSNISGVAQSPKRKRTIGEDDDALAAETAEAVATKKPRFSLLKDDTTETAKAVEDAVKKALTAQRLGFKREMQSEVNQAILEINRRVEGEMHDWMMEVQKQAVKKAKRELEATYEAKFEHWKSREMGPDLRRIMSRGVKKLIEQTEAGMDNWKIFERNKAVEEELSKRWGPLHKKCVEKWKAAENSINQNTSDRWDLYKHKEKLYWQEIRIEKEKRLLEEEIKSRRAELEEEIKARRAEVAEEERRQQASVMEMEARVEDRIRAQYNLIIKDLKRNARIKGREMDPQTLKNLDVSLREEPLSPKSQLKVDREVERQMRHFAADMIKPYNDQLELERKAHLNEMQECEAKLEARLQKFEKKCSEEFRRLMEICEKPEDDAKKFAAYRALARKAGVIGAGNN